MSKRKSNWGGPLKSTKNLLIIMDQSVGGGSGQHGRVALPDSSGVMLRHPNFNPAIWLEMDSSMMHEAETTSL